jgi:hypothetical protein
MASKDDMDRDERTARAAMAEAEQYAAREGGPYGDSLPTYPESQSLRDALFWAEANIELHRARGLFPGEEGELTDAEWHVVLGEEFGEVSRALQDETDDRLRAELVQVAAMAARWAGAIPAGRVRVPWQRGARGDASKFSVVINPRSRADDLTKEDA